jgi:hypothetical protein
MLINPNDPENEIFDPFAKRELRKKIYAGIYILLTLLPLAAMKVMFYSMLSK